MKKCLGLMAVLALLAIPAAANQAERVGDVPDVVVDSQPGPIWAGPVGSVLVDNGPLITSPGTGSGGDDESFLQSVSLGLNLLGFGHQVAAGNRVADDINVGGEGWILNECTFFAYQTGSTTTSTMTAINLRIFDATPPGGAVVFGDDSTNVLASTGYTNIFRVTETTGGANNRPIMAQSVDMGGLFLSPGTYWLDWQTDGSLGSGPWAPPVTIVGEATTGNGLQSVDDGVSYAAAIDDGTNTAQGFPFVCTGELLQSNPLEVPTLGQFGLIALLLSLAGAGIARMRRS